MTRIQLSKEQIQKILDLREQGDTYTTIEQKLELSKRAVAYHCRANLVSKKKSKEITNEAPALVNPQTNQELLPREKYNPGKNYKEYLQVLSEREKKPLKSYLPWKGNYKGRKVGAVDKGEAIV